MRTRSRNLIIICFLCIVILSIFTFPLIFRLHTHIPGFQSTDESFGALWNFWWLKYISIRHLPDTSCSSIAAPFGIDSAESGYPIWNFINKALSVSTGSVFAYNLEILFGFFVSSLFMYYLALYVTGNKACSFFSAIIYAYCPYHFARAWQHLGLAQIQWMPLYLLALLKLKDKPDIKHTILAALSLFLVFAFDFYYAYFMIIASVLFIIFVLARGWREKFRNVALFKGDIRLIARLTVCVFIVFILISPSLYQIFFKNKPRYSSKVASAHNPYIRPFEDLFAQSARPLSYLLPATTHPVFGRFTDGFIGTAFYGGSLTEHALYLGWVPMVLAFIAFRNRRQDKKMHVNDFSIGFFVFLAFAAWLFSQPPWWNLLGFKLYMPPFFMYKILPMFRAYCRFGILVMLAVSVLAGLGLKSILERYSDGNKRTAVAALFFILAVFEFWNYPPYKVIEVSQFPAAYYWLKEQPGDFIIAEYPLDAVSPNEMFKFYQTKHEKKIINGTIPGTDANSVAKTLTILSDSNTAIALKRMGVKFVLVHRQDYLETGLVEEKEELGRIAGNPAIKLIKSFPAMGCPEEDVMCIQRTGPIDIYEIAASAVKPEENR